MKSTKLKMYIDEVVYKDEKNKILNKKEREYCEEENIPVKVEFTSEIKDVVFIWETLPPMIAYIGKHSETDKPLTVVEALQHDAVGSTVLFNVVETPEELLEKIKNA